MAASKKTAKSAEKAAEVVKAEVVEPVKAEEATSAVNEAPAAEEAPKAEEKKKPGRRPKTAKAEVENKPVAESKPAAKKAVKKVELKSSICVQFADKSYPQEDLIKIAQDVWKYDLKQKVKDLATIELYVKPEEGKVYYVMNHSFMGDFTI